MKKTLRYSSCAAVPDNRAADRLQRTRTDAHTRTGCRHSCPTSGDARHGDSHARAAYTRRPRNGDFGDNRDSIGPPTSTYTPTPMPVPPTATPTLVPPTATPTPVPPTATSTPFLLPPRPRLCRLRLLPRPFLLPPRQRRHRFRAGPNFTR